MSMEENSGKREKDIEIEKRERRDCAIWKGDLAISERWICYFIREMIIDDRRLWKRDMD